MSPEPAYTVLTLPYESMRTLHRLASEVRLYKNEITTVLKIGKRVSALAVEETIVFREARLLEAIDSDYIVPVYDVARVNGPDDDPAIKVIEMVMPYYPKGSVCDALLRGERFSVAEAVRLTRDALCGLDVLHEQHKVLHGDIKSGNVFLDGDRARIGDLGMAVQMDDKGSAEPLPALQPSTPPETFTAKRHDRRSDLYGVGLVLHELLNGPFPYKDYGPSLMQPRLNRGKRAVLNDHLIQQPHVPARLRTVITKATSRDPADRYRSAREMIDALDHAPFVDWNRVDDVTWEGAVPGAPANRYRVSVSKKKRPERLRLSGEKFITAWRRCVDDQDVTDLAGKETRAFFDQLVALATSA